MNPTQQQRARVAHRDGTVAQTDHSCWIGPKRRLHARSVGECEVWIGFLRNGRNTVIGGVAAEERVGLVLIRRFLQRECVHVNYAAEATGLDWHSLSLAADSWVTAALESTEDAAACVAPPSLASPLLDSVDFT